MTLEKLLDSFIGNTDTHWVKYKDSKLVLVGEWSDQRKEGALTAPEAYLEFAFNIAHLFDDGKIRSMGREVGDVTELEYLGLATIEQIKQQANLDLAT
jgi:hypothetical protein